MSDHVKFVKWLAAGAPGGNAEARDAAECVRLGRIRLDDRTLTGLQRRAIDAARRCFEELDASTPKAGRKLKTAPIGSVKVDSRRRSAGAGISKCAGCGQNGAGLTVTADGRRQRFHHDCWYRKTGRPVTTADKTGAGRRGGSLRTTGRS